jgi:hypothetical protein
MPRAGRAPAYIRPRKSNHNPKIAVPSAQTVCPKKAQVSTRVGTAPKDIKRIVSTRAQHSFGEPAEEYNPASEDGEETIED